MQEFENRQEATDIPAEQPATEPVSRPVTGPDTRTSTAPPERATPRPPTRPHTEIFPGAQTDGTDRRPPAPRPGPPKTRLDYIPVPPPADTSNVLPMGPIKGAPKPHVHAVPPAGYAVKKPETKTVDTPEVDPRHETLSPGEKETLDTVRGTTKSTHKTGSLPQSRQQGRKLRPGN